MMTIEENDLSTEGQRPDAQSGDGKPPSPVSRRGLLTKGAGVAAAGLGLAALAADPAHAASGNPMVLGQLNDAGADTTTLISTNAQALQVFNNNNGPGGGVAIRAKGTVVAVVPDSQVGSGVIAEGLFGVQAIGRTVGMRGSAQDPGGVPLQLAPAAIVGPPTVGDHIVGDVYNDLNGHLYICVVAGAPGTWVQPGFNPVDPFRAVDTRSGIGAPVGKLGPGQELEIAFWGVGGVVPGATAVTCNLTVTGPTAGSFLTVYPVGTGRPTTSNINFVAGQTISNQMTVKLGTDGKVKVYNSSGSTHVIIDLAGFYY